MKSKNKLYVMVSSKNALVIGISEYEHISPLSRTVNDAEDIAKILRKLGFAVMLETNPTLTEFEDALENFANSIQYNKDVALFYYSGHGIQVDGKNYLIPKNAELDREIRIKKQTIDMEEVIQSVSAARNELNIFILDACRDNPFSGKFKSVNRGLAEIKKMPPSTYFAYAAAAGQTASDGTEGARNGIFTESFLKVLEEYSSEEIDMIFRKTRSSVLKKTKNVQEPWTNHNLSERYYLIEQKESNVETHGSASTPIVETPIPTVGIGRDHSDVSIDKPAYNTKKWGIIAVTAIVLLIGGWFRYSKIKKPNIPEWEKINGKPEQLSWDYAVERCKKLNSRLPTIEEWGKKQLAPEEQEFIFWSANPETKEVEQEWTFTAKDKSENLEEKLNEHSILCIKD